MTKTAVTVPRVVWVELHEINQKSQEEALRDGDLQAVIWVAEFDHAWGDDWNDHPANANAGPPYLEHLTNLRKIEIRLGQEWKE